MSERIPRKPGQPAKSDKHSDLYTDEDPKGTIHGLKFATPEDAKASVSKIKSSGRSHAHKIQAAVAMEQRAKEMGKASSAAVYRSFINSMKDKTKEMQEDWSNKYKKSIDCNNPKGFSQKAHCQARKLRQSGKETKSQPVNETMKKEMRFCPKCEKMETKSECVYGPNYWEKYATPMKQEDVPVNNVGGGQIAGVGVGAQGEPGITKKKRQMLFGDFIRRKMN